MLQRYVWPLCSATTSSLKPGVCLKSQCSVAVRVYRRVSVTAAAAALLLSFNRNENFRELHTKQKLKTARDAFQSISHVLLNKAVAIYY